MERFDKETANNHELRPDSDWIVLDKNAMFFEKRANSCQTQLKTSSGNNTTIETASTSYDDAYDGLYAFFHGDWLVGMDSDDLNLALFNEPNASAVYYSTEYSTGETDGLLTFIKPNTDRIGTFLICFEGLSLFESYTMLKTLFPENYGNYVFNVYERDDDKQVIRVLFVLK